MTPTQPSQAVEAAERTTALDEFTEYFVRNYPGPDTIINDPHWHAPKIFSAALHALRAELARPVDVTAPVTDADVTKALLGMRFTATGLPKPEDMRRALEGFAASRVPVALPAEPVAGYTYCKHGVSADDSCMACMVRRSATPAPKQGDSKDARPDSFHSDSGDRDRVQGSPLTAEIVNRAKINAADMPHTVVEKLRAAILASKATAAGEGK